MRVPQSPGREGTLPGRSSCARSVATPLEFGPGSGDWSADREESPASEPEGGRPRAAVRLGASAGGEGRPRGRAAQYSAGSRWTFSACVVAMTTDAAGKPAPSAVSGQAGRARKLGRWLARWWSQAPDGRTYQRRRADALMAAAGLGVVVVCGALVANRTVVGTDVAVFRRINQWPGWLYPPMWTAQLSGVIGALPLVAAAAALLRRLRLAVALAAATLLKVWLEAVAKMFVQRYRPAQTLPDVILRGQSAAHGLSFPSGHAMVIFTITAVVAPYFKGWWKVLPWALGAAVSLSRAYLGAHFPLDVIAGAGLGLFIGSVLNLVFGVPGAITSTACASR